MKTKQKQIWKKINWLQIQEILKHKWIESEKAGRDVGNQAIFDWIQKYAADFRHYWERKLNTENEKDEE